MENIISKYSALLYENQIKLLALIKMLDNETELKDIIQRNINERTIEMYCYQEFVEDLKILKLKGVA